jgi:AAA15 family ATPase/GTPase
LRSLVVKNFRVLEEIEVELDPRVNVIVGPNAVGKTTLLEAIRFAKAMLAPRTQNESNQVMFALGASSPHSPQALIYDAIAFDPRRPLFIRCSYVLSDDEFDFLQREESLNLISARIMLANLGREFAGPAETIALFSRPDGQAAVATHVASLRGFLSTLRAQDRTCKLELTINPTNGQMTSGDPLGAALISFLDRTLSPNQTKFSYFPADRAIPTQDPPVQIGAADAVNQLEAHNSQPQLKYQRLKNTIFNAVVEGKDQSQKMESEFERIFSRILKGKRLLGVGVNEHGMFRIQIRDDEGGKEYSLDAMSSGEKGLILTFLLIARTVVSGGIVILDEPELHLNPAVCKGLLGFLAEEYAIARSVQLIICSHSPEILSGAFDRDDCALFHLISGKLITLVRQQDLAEVGEALQRLGTSHSESLLYRGTVFVEGVQDSEVLEAGFEGLFRRFKFKDLGGRQNIEKEIRSLQDAEKRGVRSSKLFFIFDRDDAPSGLGSSEGVKVLQWPRRCLENYLIDVGVLTDLLKDPKLVTNPVRNVGELRAKLKSLAKLQLDDIASRKVYEGYAFSSPGLRHTEVQGKTLQEIASILFGRLGEIRGQVCSLNEEDWKRTFIQDCEERKRELEESWDETWVNDCDGKRLFTDLQRDMGINEQLVRFKKRIIINMKDGATEGWRTMESLLVDLMGGSAS